MGHFKKKGLMFLQTVKLPKTIRSYCLAKETKHLFTGKKEEPLGSAMIKRLANVFKNTASNGLHS
ncbi:hypothetical protein BO225_11625 [Dubosiella newyorkensis]|uniref:Uncharacterized protein n=1 Tax=Dubosiella newyorkensis TaxID=1862672 RepID=A0A1U7NJK7_9FIRM|nr:hypothetical protein BO225_11625 [Dubosiella newyorkensis]